MQLADEVIVCVGGVLAILPGVFDQDIDRSLFVASIVEPADRAAVSPDVGQQSFSVVCRPAGIRGPDGEGKILQISFNVAQIGVARRAGAKGGGRIENGRIGSPGKQSSE